MGEEGGFALPHSAAKIQPETFQQGNSFIYETSCFVVKQAGGLKQNHTLSLTLKGENRMNDQEVTIFKTAVAAHRTAAGGPSAAAAPGAIWRVINRPNRDSAVAFINLAPAQKAGEAAFSNRPDGTVDTYYFL